MTYHIRGVLEERADQFAGLSPRELMLRYPCDFGVLYEKAKSTFGVAVPAQLLAAWIRKNNRDPIRDFPWPSELPNLYFWAQKQAEKNGIVPVHSDQGAISAVDKALSEMGYQGFRVYGTSEAETHFGNSLRAHARSKTPPSQRSGARKIGDILRETLDGIL